MRLGKLLGNLMQLMMSRRSQIALENTALAFPQMTKNERKLFVRKHFEHQGQLIVEVLDSLRWRRAEFEKRIKVTGSEILHQLQNEGKGGVILFGHLGNFELAILGIGLTGIKYDVIVKGFTSRQFWSFMTWHRSRTGARIRSESVPMNELWKAFSDGRFVVFVLDQFMGPPIGIPVKFFGQTAGTAAGLALITEKSPVPVIPMRSFRDQNGNLEIQFEPPLVTESLSEGRSARLYEKTQAYNDVLESLIRENPTQWTWLHRRWKEFKGVPRWAAPVFFWVSLLLANGCAFSHKTETGIALPPDPTISIPDVVAQNPDGGPAGKATAAGVLEEPPPPAEPVKKAEKKKKGRRVEKATAAAFSPAVEPPKKVRAASWDKIPWEVGEQMVIEGSWMGLPAGRATLEVRPSSEFGGRNAFHFWANATSSRLVDAILHVDNTIETYVDAVGLFPYKFLLHMVETYQNKETRVSFDHNRGVAYYWSKRISQKMGNDDQDRADPFPPFSQDMWSSFYFLRVQDFQLNKKIHIPVYENAKNMVAELIPVANELVHTKAGVFQAWKVLVELKLNNVLRPSGAMYMWVSDDSKRYLVKFDIKLVIGSLNGELVSIRDRL